MHNYYNTSTNPTAEQYQAECFVSNPNHPAGFTGTFAFTSHRKIPELFLGFLQRHFGQFRVNRIPLEDINAVMNDLWEGPGSFSKIVALEHEAYHEMKPVHLLATDLLKITKEEKEDLEIAD